MESITIEDACKKDFEVFCDLWNYDKTIDENGFYSHSLTDRLFVSFCNGWQASRKALVVELPSIFSDRYESEICFTDDVESSLDKAGVAYE